MKVTYRMVISSSPLQVQIPTLHLIMGDWTKIPNDTNIDPDTFFNYVKIFSLKENKSITYYASETEDMADQDVSAFTKETF